MSLKLEILKSSGWREAGIGAGIGGVAGAGAGALAHFLKGEKWRRKNPLLNDVLLGTGLGIGIGGLVGYQGSPKSGEFTPVPGRTLEPAEEAVPENAPDPVPRQTGGPVAEEEPAPLPEEKPVSSPAAEPSSSPVEESSSVTRSDADSDYGLSDEDRLAFDKRQLGVNNRILRLREEADSWKPPERPSWELWGRDEGNPYLKRIYEGRDYASGGTQAALDAQDWLWRRKEIFPGLSREEAVARIKEHFLSIARGRVVPNYLASGRSPNYREGYTHALRDLFGREDPDYYNAAAELFNREWDYSHGYDAASSSVGTDRLRAETAKLRDQIAALSAASR